MEQRRIMGHFATGVTVITARVGEELHGMTANAVTSLSLEPPLVLVAVDLKASMYQSLQSADGFAMNILAADQQDLSNRFATSGPKEFSDIPQTTAVTGAPIFTEALGYVDCKISEIFSGGDHDIFVGEILAGDIGAGEPLLYYGGSYRFIKD